MIDVDTSVVLAELLGDDRSPAREGRERTTLETGIQI